MFFLAVLLILVEELWFRSTSKGEEEGELFQRASSLVRNCPLKLPGQFDQENPKYTLMCSHITPGCKRCFDPLSLSSVLWYQQNQMISVAHFPKETVQSSNDGHTVFVENNDHASRTRRTFNDPMLQLLSYYVDVFLMNNLRRRGSYM